MITVAHLPDVTRRLFTAAEVAAMLGVSKQWLYQHANGTRQPQIACVKMGAAVRFRSEDVEAFIERCRRAA